jgi:hypothetical protein
MITAGSYSMFRRQNARQNHKTKTVTASFRKFGKAFLYFGTSVTKAAQIHDKIKSILQSSYN